MCKKLLGFIQAHREAYGDIETVNYDKVFADVEQAVDLQYELPQSKFDHVFKASRHMNFLMDFEPVIKNTSGEVGGTMPNYFSMIEDLQKHVSLVTT